jgi:CO/xanthine dehydrogenase FAD-binding subunit
MKPPVFEYFAPRSLDDTLSLLSQHGEDGKILAGGQSLLPMLNFRLLAPSCLIDINRIDGLSGIALDGQDLVIGATTRTRALEFSREVTQACPLICEVVPHIAHFQIRNRGTVGGSLSHADPAAELPATMAALGARFVLMSLRGERSVTANEFFTGYLTTCLEPDEMLTQIRVPAQAPSSGYAFLEVSRRHGDFALVGVAAVLSLDADGRCASARIVLTGAHETPFCATAAADVLRGSLISHRHIDQAASLVTEGLEPQSDIHASSEYRLNAARVLTGRVLTKAVERARERSGLGGVIS